MYRLVKATGRELTALAMPSATDFVNNISIPNPGNNVMQNYTEYFTYDQIGNITLHDHYTTGQSPNWSKEYCYDDINTNNYLSKHDVNQTLPDYTYDVHGNITTMPHLSSMQWDYKDQLREVELNLSGDTAYYIYDNTGNRVRKVIEKGSIREERYYVGGYEVYRKFVSGDLDFERQTLHVDDDKSKVALIETKTIEDGDPVSPLEITIRYQYSNHLGTACLELDDTADIISYEEYHPFGTTSYRSGRNQVDVSLKRYKYVGKERDEETGLYYYGARYYADWLCRFVSVDPLQFKYPELTPFQYASNRPITLIDIDGLEGTANVGVKPKRTIGEALKAAAAKAASAKGTTTSTSTQSTTNTGLLPILSTASNTNTTQWPLPTSMITTSSSLNNQGTNAGVGDKGITSTGGIGQTVANNTGIQPVIITVGKETGNFAYVRPYDINIEKTAGNIYIVPEYSVTISDKNGNVMGTYSALRFGVGATITLDSTGHIAKSVTGMKIEGIATGGTYNVFGYIANYLENIVEPKNQGAFQFTLGGNFFHTGNYSTNKPPSSLADTQGNLGCIAIQKDTYLGSNFESFKNTIKKVANSSDLEKIALSKKIIVNLISVDKPTLRKY